MLHRAAGEYLGGTVAGFLLYLEARLADDRRRTLTDLYLAQCGKALLDAAARIAGGPVLRASLADLLSPASQGDTPETVEAAVEAVLQGAGIRVKSEE